MQNREFLIFLLLICKPIFSKFPLYKIGYWNITRDKNCGIAIYTEELKVCLEKRGIKTIIYNNSMSDKEIFFDCLKRNQIQILNIQYEASHFENIDLLVYSIKKIQSIGIKVIVTFHIENEHKNRLVDTADYSIVHRRNSQDNYYQQNVIYIPHGVSVCHFSKEKEELRIKYGFSAEKIILTTFGFLLDSKNIDGILNEIAPFIKSNPRYHLQLLTAKANVDSSFSQGFSIEKQKVENVILKHKLSEQITWITEFLTKEEIHERLFLSDLGYVWWNVPSIFATSGSAKDFISSRLPVVLNKCNHFDELEIGVIKTQNDIENFKMTIIETLENKEKLLSLRKDLCTLYDSLNNDRIILDHIDLFEKIIN